jgi:hypothetical protein
LDGSGREGRRSHTGGITRTDLPATPIDDVGDSENMRPGESYSIYDSRDILGTLPEEYEMVLERAARWVGVSESYLCQVIEMFERRLVKWGEVEKKERWRRNWRRGMRASTSREENSGDESEGVVSGIR